MSGSQPQSAFVYWVQKERIDELHELCFWQTVEQHKEDSDSCLWFGEKALESIEEFLHQILSGNVFRRTVGCGFRQYPVVVNTHREEESGQYDEYYQPGKRNVTGCTFEGSGSLVLNLMIYSEQ